MADRQISRQEAAERLGVSVATVDRYALSGRLTRSRNEVTGRVTFPLDQVEHLRELRTAGEE